VVNPQKIVNESDSSTVFCGLTGLKWGKRGGVHEKERIFMNEKIEQRKSPEVKPWVRRVDSSACEQKAASGATPKLY
jgi:hypothetical protein